MDKVPLTWWHLNYWKVTVVGVLGLTFAAALFILYLLDRKE